jgi:DnaK suppressor protein
MAVDPDKARERLLALREEIQAASRQSEEDRAPVALDQQSVGRLSRIDALQQQAMAQASERARARELQRLGAALRRIEEGEYGWCAECGDAIAERRLEVDPCATLCVDCAGRA